MSEEKDKILTKRMYFIRRSIMLDYSLNGKKGSKIETEKKNFRYGYILTRLSTR